MQPKHVAFCISGFSGTGKDEIAKRLVERHGAIHTGLADPAKRHMAEVYGFTREQLFGPSEMRNGGDVRYPKNVIRELDAKPHGTYEGPGASFEGVVGDLEIGKTYWMFSGRRASVGQDSLPSDLPYRPLRLGNAEVFFPEEHPFFFLSPRECLQKYCDLMNTMYEDTWVRHGIETQRKIANSVFTCVSESGAYQGLRYDRMVGLHKDGPARVIPEFDGFVITCFSDFRHRHEIRHVRNVKDDGFIPVVVRVKRPGIEKPPFNHRSETEQAQISDNVFDVVIDNDGTIPDLHLKVDDMVSKVKRERA